MCSEFNDDYLRQTREELDLHYSPSRWSKRQITLKSAEAVVKDHIEVMDEASAKAKEALLDDQELAIPYGNQAKEKMDIFGAQSLPQDAPVYVYMHGGYWQSMCRENSSFQGPALVKNGIIVVAIGYELAPSVGMEEIVSEVRKAMAHILKWAHKRGSRGVYMGGHCAGGHLLALMLAIDWMEECGIPNELLKGAVSFSGLYDIRPVARCYVNDVVKMSERDHDGCLMYVEQEISLSGTPALDLAFSCREDVALESSPCKHIDAIGKLSEARTVLCTIAEEDPPAFRKQAEEFIQALQKRNVRAQLLDMDKCDHFQGIEKAQLESDDVIQKMCSMMCAH